MRAGPDAGLPAVAAAFRRDVRHPQGGVANINGEMHYSWRAVDHEGEKGLCEH